jgi:hypothetical protein
MLLSEMPEGRVAQFGYSFSHVPIGQRQPRKSGKTAFLVEASDAELHQELPTDAFILAQKLPT